MNNKFALWYADQVKSELDKGKKKSKKSTSA